MLVKYTSRSGKQAIRNAKFYRAQQRGHQPTDTCLKAEIIRFNNSKNFKAGRGLGLNDYTQGVNGVKEERQGQSYKNKYTENEQRESQEGC